ncbi:hypothetical protein [Desulfolutivibrio sulfoxidireducens]|uniref:hypothetical protein n=1 Tax=Desulfolutivibrio sulfoxidireducens TaxID=2773299 RepID=UPI00159E7A88|nr:hypothetical protein [Desulfolutivibrio sulfoxidireducens]QLA20057.1 hypothetical protein GD604_10140 [Desulfolutivibrio sulfoxidireducens]
MKPLPFLFFTAVLAACLSVAGPARAKGVKAKIAGLERRYEQRMAGHERRLERLDATVAAYDPSKLFRRVEASNAAHEARHAARVARGEALALAADGKTIVTPGVSQAPRR